MTRDVSVLITSFNERPFIGAALDSVMGQTAIDRIARIMVVDDGSTDGSLDLLRERAAKCPLVEIQSIANVGIAAARNHGLRQIGSVWVALLDGDDLWAPDKLERQLAGADRADRAGGADLLYSDYVDFRDQPDRGVPIRVNRYGADTADLLRKYFLHDGPVVPSTVLLRTQSAAAVEYFDPGIRLFEDTDFCLRLAEAGFRFQHVEGDLAFKRRREDSLSARVQAWETAMAECTRAWTSRRGDLAPLAARREGFRLAKIADAWFAAGEAKQGWRYLRKALARNPYNLRVYAYAALAPLPYNLREYLKRRLRRLRARLT